MAVSMTQLSHEASKRRSMAMTCYPPESTYMPMPEHFHQSYPQPFPQHAYMPPLPPPPPPQHYGYQQFSHPSYYYEHHAPPEEEQPPSPPPRPPKTPIEAVVEEVPPLPQRPRADTTSTIIEPDPLPPHSNPQALTATQSQAFEDSSSMPPVRVGKEEVYNSRSGLTLFVIRREAAHVPAFLSSKPLLTVMRVDGTTMGSVRFHKVTSSNIDLTINGRPTSISHSGFVHNRWGFQSTTRPNVDERWFWKKDKITGGAQLVDSKKSGHALAKMKGDLLTFEKSKLSDASYDEVLLSAVAMAEAARRQKRNSDVADIASAIGDFTSSDGGGDGSGGDGGGGGN